VHKRARIYDSILSCASRVSVFKLALGGDHRRTRRALDSQFSACLTTLHCRVTVLSPLRPPYSLHTCDDTSCCCNQSVSSCAIGPIQLCSVAKSNLTVVCVLTWTITRPKFQSCRFMINFGHSISLEECLRTKTCFHMRQVLQKEVGACQSSRATLVLVVFDLERTDMGPSNNKLN
jgi:hypothetical protein